MERANPKTEFLGRVPMFDPTHFFSARWLHGAGGWPLVSPSIRSPARGLPIRPWLAAAHPAKSDSATPLPWKNVRVAPQQATICPPMLHRTFRANDRTTQSTAERGHPSRSSRFTSLFPPRINSQLYTTAWSLGLGSTLKANPCGSNVPSSWSIYLTCKAPFASSSTASLKNTAGKSILKSGVKIGGAYPTGRLRSLRAQVPRRLRIPHPVLRHHPTPAVVIGEGPPSVTKSKPSSNCAHVMRGSPKM